MKFKKYLQKSTDEKRVFTTDCSLKNPYLVDFPSLGKDAPEREVEEEVVAHIEKFLLELGEGFAFLGYRYHLQILETEFVKDLKGNKDE